MNTNMVKGAVSLALVMFGVACGSDEGGKSGGYEVSQSALTGTIAGEAFEAKSGFAKDFFGDGEYWVELHNTEVEEPCSAQFPAGPHIILSVKPEPMDQALSLQNNITFAHGEAENDIATSGRLIIDGVQGDRLTGGLIAEMGDSEVDGTFDVKVCAD